VPLILQDQWADELSFVLHQELYRQPYHLKFALIVAINFNIINNPAIEFGLLNLSKWKKIQEPKPTTTEGGGLVPSGIRANSKMFSGWKVPGLNPEMGSAWDYFHITGLVVASVLGGDGSDYGSTSLRKRILFRTI
jgi:hypothetical protein